ncbi:hypothetical protein CXG81DRAFT_23064 [Caulochytrium protostelioides]|uniref:Uncharacterized protein n=1 Tax=Caulochytrium protostelioides TaxID=1555241 RepID=A0A4P9XFF8_9FUNG|nr:hypothetical protein CXG81DRAFT_23064 [Caulochytrium protostelioides]|eukprot:RKP04288.1 hypothetical protein CXG81DRAFT_23064 [Caulochytrium protostelioides]
MPSAADQDLLDFLNGVAPAVPATTTTTTTAAAAGPSPPTPSAGKPDPKSAIPSATRQLHDEADNVLSFLNELTRRPVAPPAPAAAAAPVGHTAAQAAAARPASASSASSASTQPVSARPAAHASPPASRDGAAPARPVLTRPAAAAATTAPPAARAAPPEAAAVAAPPTSAAGSSTWGWAGALLNQAQSQAAVLGATARQLATQATAPATVDQLRGGVSQLVHHVAQDLQLGASTASALLKGASYSDLPRPSGRTMAWAPSVELWYCGQGAIATRDTSLTRTHTLIQQHANTMWVDREETPWPVCRRLTVHSVHDSQPTPRLGTLDEALAAVRATVARLTQLHATVATANAADTRHVFVVAQPFAMTVPTVAVAADHPSQPFPGVQYLVHFHAPRGLPWNHGTDYTALSASLPLAMHDAMVASDERPSPPPRSAAPAASPTADDPAAAIAAAYEQRANDLWDEVLHSAIAMAMDTISLPRHGSMTMPPAASARSLPVVP